MDISPGIEKLTLKRTTTSSSSVSSSGANFKLIIRDVRDNQAASNSHLLSVRPWSTVMDVKVLLQNLADVPVEDQRLFYGPFGCEYQSKSATHSFQEMTFELLDHHTLRESGIYQSGVTLFFNTRSIQNESSAIMSLTMLQPANVCPSDVCIPSTVWDITPRGMRKLIHLARQGFAVGLKPELGIDGSGGTYFLRDSYKGKVCVFKPADEEPYAVNNPRGYLSTRSEDAFMREGVAPGQACLREVAAFLLDHEGFSSVPMTTLAVARHPNFNVNGSHLSVAQGGAAIGMHSIFSSPLVSSAVDVSVSPHSVGNVRSNNKIGSCQEFVYAECTMDDISPSKISVDEIHKIAVLDIRLMNADRNTANLLCRRKEDNSLELIPIDHGFCLRSSCDVAWFDWCWLDWPQLKEPISEDTKKYILGLDIEKDVQVLKERLHIDDESLNIFRASSNLLKIGVKEGLNLHQIAYMCARHDDAGEVKSRLEVLVSLAREITAAAVQNGRWDHVVASRALADQLSPLPASFVKNPSSKMIKSTSMFVMDSIGIDDDDNDGDLFEMAPFSTPPSANASSGSDSSEEVIGDDNEVQGDECGFWAASVIDDANKAINSKPSIRSRQRANSICSSTSSDGTSGSASLSSSPKGFWIRRPDSPDDDIAPKTVSWSPSTSPAPSFLLNHMKESKTPLVSTKRMFKSANMARYENENYLDRFAAQSSNSDTFQMHEPKKGMTRCQSYSAFSSTSSSFGSSATMDRSKLSTEDINSSQYQDYFKKFVDLLVEREILSAGRNRSDS